MNRPLRSQLPTLYGNIVNGVWAEQAMWTTALSVPFQLQPYWLFQGKPVAHVTVNKDMADALYAAWNNIIERGVTKSIISFDGCLAIRQSRVDDRPSVHSWGLAVDINAARNLLGTPGNQPPALVGCFTDAGFVWGGSWKNPDPMHFQYVTEDL